jgi:hypothetical protein
VLRVQLDHKAHKGREVLKGYRAHKELQVQLYHQVILVQQEHKVLRVHKAHKGRLDHKDKKEPKGFRTSVYKELKVLLVLVVQVPRVLQGFKVLKELQDQQLVFFIM